MFDDEAAVEVGGDLDDLEVIIEGGIEGIANDDADENQDNVEGNQPDPEGTPQQPKRRVVKNPQPKLNPERLRGPRGIATLENVFKDFKFHGKGYEKHDLNRMMKQLEHWAHRLYPRFQFDDCLEKIEKLGNKKPVGTLVKRIRMGLEIGDEPVVRAEDEDGGDAADRIPDFGADTAESPLDAFDALLSQQLLEARARTPKQPQPSTQLSQPQQVLTEEQRERMLRNRQLAEERRTARLKAQADKYKQLENEENSQNRQLSCDVIVGVEQNAVAQEVANVGADHSDRSFQKILSQNCPEPDVSGNLKNPSQCNPQQEEKIEGTILNEKVIDCETDCDKTRSNKDIFLSSTESQEVENNYPDVTAAANSQSLEMDVQDDD